MTEDFDLSGLGRNPAQVTLAAATRVEMADELRRRHKCVVLMVLDSEDDGVKADFIRRGNAYALVGMAEQFIHGVLHEPEDDE